MKKKLNLIQKQRLIIKLLNNRIIRLIRLINTIHKNNTKNFNKFYKIKMNKLIINNKKLKN